MVVPLAVAIPPLERRKVLNSLSFFTVVRSLTKLASPIGVKATPSPIRIIPIGRLIR